MPQGSLPYEIHGVTKVDYLIGFVSLLYAFSVSEFFMGWSKMLRNRHSISFSFDHILFSVLFFWLLILNWYGLWVRMEYLNKGFLYFILIIIPIIIVYIASVFIFPDLDKTNDLKNYSEKNFNRMLICCALFVSANIFIGLGIGEYQHHHSKTILLRLFNCILILSVALLNLKKLRKPILIWIAIGLTMGSIELAFK